MTQYENLKRGEYQASGTYISDGWDLFKRNTGGFIGFILLIILISIVLDMIPVVGSLVSNVLSPILMAGFYLVAQKVWLGKEHAFGDFFGGFSHPQMWQLVLVQVIMVLIMLLFFIPGLIGMFPYISELRQGDFSSMDEFPTASIGLFCLALIPLIYLSVAWIWAPFFVLFKGMPAWEAMETSRQIITKKWGSFFGLILLIFLLNIGGALLLVVGLLVTIPVSILAIYLTFERIVGTVENNEDYHDEIIKHLVD